LAENLAALAGICCAHLPPAFRSAGVRAGRPMGTAATEGRRSEGRRRRRRQHQRALASVGLPL